MTMINEWNDKFRMKEYLEVVYDGTVTLAQAIEELDNVQFVANDSMNGEQAKEDVKAIMEALDGLHNEANTNLLEACQFTLQELNSMTTDEFSKGADKKARRKLEVAIAQAKEKKYCLIASLD